MTTTTETRCRRCAVKLINQAGALSSCLYCTPCLKSMGHNWWEVRPWFHGAVGMQPAGGRR